MLQAKILMADWLWPCCLPCICVCISAREYGCGSGCSCNADRQVSWEKYYAERTHRERSERFLRPIECELRDAGLVRIHAYTYMFFYLLFFYLQFVDACMPSSGNGSSTRMDAGYWILPGGFHISHFSIFVACFWGRAKWISLLLLVLSVSRYMIFNRNVKYWYVKCKYIPPWGYGK